VRRTAPASNGCEQKKTGGVNRTLTVLGIEFEQIGASAPAFGRSGFTPRDGACLAVDSQRSGS